MSKTLPWIFIALIAYLHQPSARAMVPTTVSNPERLFVRQETIVWCWAAISSGLTNFYYKKPLTQYDIALNNPKSFDKVVTYFIDPTRLHNPIVHDYLLDEVLSKEGYQAQIEPFTHDRVLSLLKAGQPIMVSQGAHVTVLYGFTYLGDELFYNYFDPYAYATPFPETGLRSWYSYDALWQEAGIIYLTKNNSTIAKHP